MSKQEVARRAGSPSEFWLESFIEKRRAGSGGDEQYAMVDVFKATGRPLGGQAAQKVKRWLTTMEMEGKAGVATFQGRLIFSEDVFVEICEKLGQVNAFMSQAARQRREERKGDIFSASDERRQLVEGVLESMPSLPQTFVTGVQNFFLDTHQAYYVIYDLLTPLGRVRSKDNKAIRAKIRRAAEARGITSANKRNSLLIPLKEAVAICAEIGPPVEQIPHAFSHDELLALLIVLRAPITQAVRERYGIFLYRESLDIINNLIAILREKKDTQNGAVDVDIILPNIVKKFHHLAARNRLIFSEDPNQQRTVKQMLSKVHRKERATFVKELCASFTG